MCLLLLFVGVCYCLSFLIRLEEVQEELLHYPRRRRWCRRRRPHLR